MPYTRSKTWSKDGDEKRDVSVRKLLRDPKFLFSHATITATCAPAVTQHSLELCKALRHFIAVGLDDLETIAVTHAALGSTLTGTGVTGVDHDRFAKAVLLHAKKQFGKKLDPNAERRLASVCAVFAKQCKLGVGPPVSSAPGTGPSTLEIPPGSPNRSSGTPRSPGSRTPNSPRAPNSPRTPTTPGAPRSPGATPMSSPKAFVIKKKTYTLGMYKKFKESDTGVLYKLLYKRLKAFVGIKRKKKLVINFNLNESDSNATPGQGPPVLEQGGTPVAREQGGTPAAREQALLSPAVRETTGPVLGTGHVAATGGGRVETPSRGNGSGRVGTPSRGNSGGRVGTSSRLGNAKPRVRDGPVHAVQPRSKRRVAAALRRDAAVERVGVALLWVFCASLVALIGTYPTVTAQHTRAALFLARDKLLGLFCLGCALRPTHFAKGLFWVCFACSLRSVLGWGFGFGVARDPWQTVLRPALCVVPRVCDNGLTTWLRLVAHGK